MDEIKREEHYALRRFVARIGKRMRHSCQRCHLHYDRQHHQETAYATRKANGTLELF